MPRYKKVPIVKGDKRVTTISGEIELRQTSFCGECGKRLKQALIQKPHLIIGHVCYNSGSHKSGKIYLWVLDDVRIH